MAKMKLLLVLVGLCVLLGLACFKDPEFTAIGVGTDQVALDNTNEDDTINPAQTSENLQCITCHQNAMADRRPVVLDSGLSSHPFGTDLLTNEDCIICHETTQHQQGVVRLWADPNNPAEVIQLTADPKTNSNEAVKLTRFCLTCHENTAFSVHDVAGDWQPQCYACHTMHDASLTNLSAIVPDVFNKTSGQIESVLFTARSGLGSLADDNGVVDGLCQVCHTTTQYHRQDGSGSLHHASSDCTACHSHSTGFKPSNLQTSCLVCHSVNQGNRQAVVFADGTGGHHLGDGVLTDDDCLLCHEMTLHRQGRVRLWNKPNAPTGVIELVGSPQSNPIEADKLIGFCSSCHASNGNIIHGVPGNWQPACAACHDLHGRDNSNLFYIRNQVRNITLAQNRDVIFRSRTGTGSYSDGVGANDGICQSCHTSTSHHQYDGGGSAHHEGENCTTCHAHNAGFLPDVTGSCITCHSSPQGNHPAVVNADGSGGHHFGSGLLSDDDCTSCHDNTNHQQGQVRLWNDASNPLTSFTVSGDPNQLVPFCKSCHSNSDHPIVHQTGTSWTPACTECHSVHQPGNTNLSLVSASILNATLGIDKPVVFTSRSGLGSFNDGVGANDGVCQVCHTTTAYHLHDGSGSSHNVASDCTACHDHNAGFAPAGETSCIGCHSVAQAARRAVVIEFGLSSHHVSGGSVADADCIVCHDQSQHRQGRVRLKNADNASIVVTLTGNPMSDPVEAMKLESVCLSCHDSNGAGGSAPFSDGQMPSVINATLWSVGSHKTGQTTCVGDGETFGCHSTGHGSMKLNLLAPFDASQLPVTGDPLRQEEGFCYGCHDVDGPASVNIQAIFAQASRHDVSSVDQSNGSNLECVNCHDPHKASPAASLIHPETGMVFEGNITEFCLTCHDGAPPASVLFPMSSLGSGFDKSAFVGSAHDTSLGVNACLDCHDPHGSPHIATLLRRYVVNDNNSYSTGDGDYALCWKCHSEQAIVEQDNRFSEYHKKHVKGEDAPCVSCHNAHGSFDAGEPGLIDLSYPDMRGFNFSFSNTDASTAFWISNSGSRGNCLLRCHGENHSPEDYQR